MSEEPTYMCLETGYMNGYPVQCNFVKGHLAGHSWDLSAMPRLEPTITVTEADARVAAFRKAFVETALRYIDEATGPTGGWLVSPNKLSDRFEQATHLASDAALRVIVARAKLDGARGLSFYSGSTTTYLDALASELAAAEADLAKR